MSYNQGLSNSQLMQALSRFPEFLGVFASNQNPFSKIKKFPCAFIMNTLDSHEIHGGHWLAFYMPTPKKLEYFDSLGNSLAHYPNIFAYFNNLSQSKIQSSKPLPSLQSNSSSLCGEFVITFLTLRLSRPSHSFKSILSLLHNLSPHKREAFINRLSSILLK